MLVLLVLVLVLVLLLLLLPVYFGLASTPRRIASGITRSEAVTTRSSTLAWEIGGGAGGMQEGRVFEARRAPRRTPP